MNLADAQVICMINARGGSKGIPRKNIRPLLGKPLIAWSIEVAQQSRHIDRIIVSTEDEEIADVARRYGAEVPFMRPAALATDTSLQMETIRYNVDQLELQGARVDIVVLLQPTNPLRTVADVDGCLELMARTGADTVVTVSELHRFHPLGLWHMSEGTELAPYQTAEPAGYNRQAMPAVYWRTGAVYVIQRRVIVERNAIYGDSVHGHLVNEPRSWFNIDSEFDWQMTEAWLRHTGDGPKKND